MHMIITAPQQDYTDVWEEKKCLKGTKTKPNKQKVHNIK